MAETLTQDTETQTETTETSGGDAEFNITEFAAENGVTEQVLDGATTKEDAIERVKAHADRIMTAGIDAPPFQATSTAEKVAENEKKADKAKDGGQPTTIEALAAEFKAYREQQEDAARTIAQQQEAALYAEIDRRVEDEMDRWESDTFGVRGRRRFEQSEQARLLQKRVKTYLAGALATGETNVPSIEVITRQVRPFVDKAPPADKKEDSKVTPLGTPGGSAKAPEGERPRNIHEAYMRSRR